MLIRRTGRGQKQDVAAWSTARQAARFTWRPPAGARVQVECVGQGRSLPARSGPRGWRLPPSNDKRHARWTPIVLVWRYTMRATDGLQTTITLGPVKDQGRVVSLELSLDLSLPMPSQDEHLPDHIEAYVHQAGLEVQRRHVKALIEQADRELVLRHRRGKGGAGIRRGGTRPFTFKT